MNFETDADDPMRISRYHPSPAIEKLIHHDSAGVRRFREIVVEKLRDATTDALNQMIDEAGAGDPARPPVDGGVDSQGFYAGMVEGFAEALYHDLAALIVAGVPMDEATATIDEIREATAAALSDLAAGFQGEGEEAE